MKKPQVITFEQGLKRMEKRICMGKGEPRVPRGIARRQGPPRLEGALKSRGETAPSMAMETVRRGRRPRGPNRPGQELLSPKALRQPGGGEGATSGEGLGEGEGDGLHLPHPVMRRAQAWR